MNVAPDSIKVLNRFEWDASLLSGNTEEGIFAHLDARYGLLDNLSGGLHFCFPQERLVDSEEEETPGAAESVP